MTGSDRDQRLAAKLRENLRRRKAQAKARSGADRLVGEDDQADDRTTDNRDDTDAKS